MPDLKFRAIEFRAADASGDAIPCVVASEEPVNRGQYDEVLSHDPDHLDLSRAPLPLIVQHDSQQLNIGIVEQLRIEGRKLRGLARFGSSELAQQILTDVKAGIVRNLSVGYRLLRPIKETGRTVRFAWQPHEASVVSVPADTQSGFFRHLKGPAMPDITVTENEQQSQTRSQRRAADRGVTEERERVMEIRALGRSLKLPETMIDQAIDDGMSLDQFRGFSIENMQKSGMLRPAESPDIGLSKREIEKFSIRKLILALGDPAYAMREAGFEVEASRATAEILHREPRGFFVPSDVLNAPRQRDLVVGTPSAGGNLVGTDHLAANFVEMLRERNLTMELGALLLGGLHGNAAIPTQTGGATGFWITEGNAPSESQQVFGQVPLTPKTVGGYSDFTRKMLLQSSPDIEMLIRADLAAVLGNAVDAAVFNGSGSGAEPKGILQQSGVGSVNVGDNGGPLTWALILEFERQLHLAVTNGATPAFVTTANARAKFKNTLKVANDAGGGWLWESGLEPNSGVVNGYRSFANSHLPSNLTKGSGTGLSAAILGDFRDVVIGMWGGLDIMLDPYALATSGGKRVIALLDVDVQVRRVASFAVCKDIQTT